jgi:uncharacterized protein
MLPDLQLALRLQSVDRKIAGLESEIATLPKHIAEIERQLESHSRKLEHDRAALTANARDKKRLEGEIQGHQQKISKLRDQSLGAKNNEQYRAFQNEINYLEGEILKAEDQILDLMESSESLEAAVAASEAAFKKQRTHVDTEKKSAVERTASDKSELATQNEERRKIAAGMTPSFYTTYERIRKKTKNTPIAEATDGRCEGCRILLRPQLFQDLRKGDSVITCESCGRLLVYNPVIDVSDNLSASQQIAAR